eukprot:ANDGO_06173.mRNA.1 hypothetical protein
MSLPPRKPADSPLHVNAQRAISFKETPHVALKRNAAENSQMLPGPMQAAHSQSPSFSQHGQLGGPATANSRVAGLRMRIAEATAERARLENLAEMKKEQKKALDSEIEQIEFHMRNTKEVWQPLKAEMGMVDKFVTKEAERREDFESMIAEALQLQTRQRRFREWAGAEASEMPKFAQWIGSKFEVLKDSLRAAQTKISTREREADHLKELIPQLEKRAEELKIRQYDLGETTTSLGEEISMMSETIANTKNSINDLKAAEMQQEAQVRNQQHLVDFYAPKIAALTDFRIQARLRVQQLQALCMKPGCGSELHAELKAAQNEIALKTQLCSIKKQENERLETEISNLAEQCAELTGKLEELQRAERDELQTQEMLQSEFRENHQILKSLNATIQETEESVEEGTQLLGYGKEQYEQVRQLTAKERDEVAAITERIQSLFADAGRIVEAAHAEIATTKSTLESELVNFKENIKQLKEETRNLENENKRSERAMNSAKGQASKNGLKESQQDQENANLRIAIQGGEAQLDRSLRTTEKLREMKTRLEAADACSRKCTAILAELAVTRNISDLARVCAKHDTLHVVFQFEKENIRPRHRLIDDHAPKKQVTFAPQIAHISIPRDRPGDPSRETPQTRRNAKQRESHAQLPPQPPAPRRKPASRFAALPIAKTAM